MRLERTLAIDRDIVFVEMERWMEWEGIVSGNWGTNANNRLAPHPFQTVRASKFGAWWETSGIDAGQRAVKIPNSHAHTPIEGQEGQLIP